MFCFFVTLEVWGVGEDERLRFVVAVTVVMVVVVACWAAESEEAVVLAAEGF